jgi:hypothetical protein
MCSSRLTPAVLVCVTSPCDGVVVICQQDRLLETSEAVVGEVHRSAEKQIAGEYAFLMQVFCELAQEPVADAGFGGSFAEVLRECAVMVVGSACDDDGAAALELGQKRLGEAYGSAWHIWQESGEASSAVVDDDDVGDPRRDNPQWRAGGHEFSNEEGLESVGEFLA